jgi:hypothetical protein
MIDWFVHFFLFKQIPDNKQINHAEKIFKKYILIMQDGNVYIYTYIYT